MNSKPIKIPGPDHPMTITPTKSRVTATVNGKRIADTREALTLKEAGDPPVQYIPRKDVDMTQLQRTARETYCLSLQGRVRLFQHSGRRRTLGQRRMELRSSLCRRIGNPGIPSI